MAKRLVVLCLMLIIFLVSAVLIHAEQIYFEDSNLTAIVYQQLAANGKQVNSENMAQIKELDASSCMITSLSGIDRLSGLQVLNISHNPIHDLLPLSSLKQLTSLNIRETSVTKLAPLSNLTNLTYLNIHSLQVESLEPLAELTNLQTLIMRNVYIGTDDAFLASMVNLRRLNVRNTGLTDTRRLAQLMEAGALQNQSHFGIKAEIDLRDNPLIVATSRDDYAPIREYWYNIFDRRPVRLPDIPTHEIVINEFMALNSSAVRTRRWEYFDWIELYNPSMHDVDLTGYYLSDDLDPFKWEFPPQTIIPAQSYLLVFASGKDDIILGEIHTNFSISSGGEPLTLSASDGTTIDYVPPVEHKCDISYGRLTDGDQFAYFLEPTPGSKNDSENVFMHIIQPPTFSHVRGFYQESFYLTLMHSDPEVTIYYTLDSSLPTQDSNVFTEPIYISQENTKTELLANIKTFGPFDLNRIELDHTGRIQRQAFMPWDPQDVFQGIVVRAVAYKDGQPLSDAATHSYFIDSSMSARYSLPVVSIATDPDNFFDDRTGIYVAGIHYRNTRPGRPWHNPANYTMRGRDWERLVHVEFFEPGGVPGFSLNMGARVHGGITRSWPQKTLRLYARSSYQSPGIIEYPLFPGLTATGTGESLVEFKRILLRNAGNHWSVNYMADALMHELIAHTTVDVQAYRPVIVFINGEYWGIQNLRERLDQYYLATHYDLDPNNVVMTTHYDELSYGEPGDERDLHDIVAFTQWNNMSIDTNYEYIQTKMDIDNYVTYQAAQIYFSNTDWPGKNTSVWRYKTDEYDPSAPYGQDGRWRWMVYDTDFGFGYAHGTSGDFNNLEHATGSRGPLLRNLLANKDFRNQFINTVADHLNTSFRLERVITLINQMEAVLEPEMADHIKRWGNPGKSVDEWKSNVDDLRVWATNRPYYMRKHVMEYFNLTGTAEVSLFSKVDEGYISINSIDITTDVPGVDSSAAWNGIYFCGVPLVVKANPYPGYEFVRWEGNITGTDPVIELTLTEDIVLTAIFTASN